MSSRIQWFIVILVIVYFLYRENKYRKRIKDISNTLEEIIEGNENLKIYIESKDTLASLVFNINKLVAFYQKDKAKGFRLEQSRKQMLSNLSHDVRTPLASVLGYLDALCKDIVDGEEKLEYLHIAQKKAYALKEYIDELFTIAQLDANELQLTIEKIDLFELLRSEIIGWIPRLESEGIVLEIEIPDEECFIMGDTLALIRILNNLLQNALRYGGDNKFIGINAWIDDYYVNFEVWDKGAGVTKEDISKVFDRLYKSDSSRSTKGHGLGLAIAKELVQKIHGKISMESEAYIKTSVKVSLPKSKK